MPTNAEVLFQEIMDEPDRASYLRAMISPTAPTFEEEWLDFKSGYEGPATIPTELSDRNLKEIWSTALSGFANTGGGVLIFGIDARPTSLPTDPTKKIDAASDLRLVPHPAVLKTRLMQLHHVATEPPVGGIRVENISDSAGGGFVICLIPEGNSKPHHALMVSGKPYYIRVGDDFDIMPHPVLRSMFYPRLEPRYSAEIHCRALNMHIPAGGSLVIGVRIENIGTATAREPYVVVQLNPHFSPEFSGAGEWRSQGNGDQLMSSIHPGAKAPQLSRRFTATKDNLYKTDLIEVRFTIYALDSAPQVFSASIQTTGIENNRPAIAALQIAATRGPDSI